KPALEVTDEEARQLAREGLNVISGKPGRAVTLKGSVTMARNCPSERAFGSLAVRRLSLRITSAVERATRWAVFQPNDPRVAERVRAQVHACLSCLADAGAFADEDFIVQCDAGHREHDHPGCGVTILLRFRPAGAADAVSLTLHQTVSGCRVTNTAFAPSLAHCA